ncbi:MAG: hypothetical protein HYT42_00285 [Candidatus Sungbacteria bacterium]|nr:hypothetical protein [Candidatus Sungbacteria bacterium]
MNQNVKTPQFDRAFDEYFSKLEFDEKGGELRVCRFSGERFYVRPEDIAFYKRMRVSLPTLSPRERSRRRLAFSSGYYFFKVKSAASGKAIITVYPPATPFKIYEHELWFSDRWNALDFGESADPGLNFFDQFRKLQFAVPRPNLNSDSSNVNSDYTNDSTHLKNCYIAFNAIEGENLYYFDCCLDNKDCVDCWSVSWSDTCYMSFGERLYKCFWCFYAFDCLESRFLYDCRNCEHCFMCSNLRNKKYHFFNKPLTKEEYESKLKEINLGNYEVLQGYLSKFEELKRTAIYKENRNINAVNSTGDWIQDSKNCHEVYYAYESEHVAYSLGFFRHRDCYDMAGATNSELCYEVMTISAADNYGDKFSTFINNCRNVEYCDLCRNSHDLFGCISLANKSFCIFNRQYSEGDYWAELDKIKTAMLERGEYGEFFPPELSPFPYNLSLATSYSGFGDIDTAKSYGYRIEDIQDEPEKEIGLETIPSSRLPTDIKDIDDSILSKVIFDEQNKKKFRLTGYELEFYRKHNLPLPRAHPLARMAEWRKMDIFKLNFEFYDRPCAKCGKAMRTSYHPEQSYRVCCEKCYLSEVA